MELRHLRYFVAVAEEMNFRRAAKKLNMTQPPLSQQIQQLEQELDCKLFIRRGRSIELTDAGNVFLKEAQAILASVTEAIEKTRRTSLGQMGILHIGFVESAVHHGLPEILKKFRIAYPDVEVGLKRLTSNQQLNALMENSIDVGFCRLHPEELSDNLKADVIIQEPICAVLPLSHYLASEAKISLKQLASDDFILFPEALGTSLHRHIMNACQQAGFKPNITQEATQFTTIVGLVATDMGVSVLPASVRAFPHHKVRYIALSDGANVPISIVRHEYNHSAVCQQFYKLAQIYLSSNL
ncbi:MAG: LysR substrate-binding domain-containing protein [Chloroflexota bacterium]